MTTPPLHRWHGAAAPPSFTPLELLVAITVGAVLAAGVLVWGTGWLLSAGDVTTGLADTPRLITDLIGNPTDPAAAWPDADRHHLPGPIAFYATTLALIIIPAAVATTVRLRLREGHRRRTADARWATRRDLADLRVRAAGGGRLILGRHHPGGALIAAGTGRSLLILGPSRSGKTSGLAIPAILEWDGPIVTTSVKTDLVRDTAGWRATKGRVQIYDPTGSTGLPAASWSPLAGATTWMGAVRTAHSMAATVKTSGSAGGLTDGDFWYASAAKLLAPLLFAAAHHDHPIANVVTWLNTHETVDVQRLLATTGVPEAVNAFAASTRRADQQRSSIYTTAETVLAAYEDPDVAASAITSDIDADRLITSDDTLYLCAPRDDQRRLRPLFVGLLHQIITAAGRHAAAHPDGRLDRPLLVVLDEAANIAPLPDLDELASTAMGLGITLITIWQDLAQIRARYGTRATTIVNNHAGMLVLRGMRDMDALRTTSDLIGRHTPPEDPTRSHSPIPEALLPAHALRNLPDGRAVGIYEHLPPFQVDLRPYYTTTHLTRRAAMVFPPLPAGTAPQTVEATRRVEGDTGVAHMRAELAVHRRRDQPPAGITAEALVWARAADLIAIAADHQASNLRMLASAAASTGVAGSHINLLVDIPPIRRLLHLSTLAEEYSGVLGHPVQVLTPDMLDNPDASLTATPVHAEPEAQP